MDVIGVPTGTQIGTALGAATLRGKEQSNSSSGTKVARAHRPQVWQRAQSLRSTDARRRGCSAVDAANEAARDADRRAAADRSMSSRLAEAVGLSRVAAELEENLRREPDVRP
jgi:hypothetical protein